MLAALALTLAATTLQLNPTDDVWVYPHASDQKDVYLRVWGAEGRDCPKKVAEVQDFSPSYLKFDVTKVPAGKVTEAKLILTHVANPGYAQDYAKDNPLRARPVSASWDESHWDYEKAQDLMPEGEEKSVFGTGYPQIPTGDKEFTITIDLLNGPNDFAKYFDQAQRSPAKNFAIALTSTVDVEAFGQRCIYKVYSTNAEAAKRPVLKLTIE